MSGRAMGSTNGDDAGSGEILVVADDYVYF